MLPFAILLGVSAGFFGGIVDDVIQYIYTTLNSVPAVLLSSLCSFINLMYLMDQ